MSRFKKRARPLHNRRFVGVVLKPDQRAELDALAADMDVEPGQVLAVGLWVLGRVGCVTAGSSYFLLMLYILSIIRCASCLYSSTSTANSLHSSCRVSISASDSLMDAFNISIFTSKFSMMCVFVIIDFSIASKLPDYYTILLPFVYDKNMSNSIITKLNVGRCVVCSPMRWVSVYNNPVEG